jgi:hypothetical protein
MEDEKFRPGVDFICYMPRLKGAEAIPTLTPKTYRESCSALCSHHWKPPPAPIVIPPPPPDPATS